jgi:HEAT repeat protein
MRQVPLRLVILIGVAVVLGGIAIGRFVLPQRVDPPRGPDPAAERIEKHRREKNVKALAKEIGSKKESTARRAVAALGRIGTEAMGHIKEAMADPRPRVRERAAQAFADAGRHDEAAPLAKMVREDRSANVRAAAVSGLEHMFAFDQMDTIIAAMDDQDVAVRRRASAAARRFSGVVVGYKAEDPPDKRRAAIATLREVWEREKAGRYKYWEMILSKYKYKKGG